MGKIGSLIVGAIAGIVVGIITRNPYAGMAVFSAVAGIGSALFPSSSDTPPPKPGSFNMQTSQYGLTIPVVYGSRRVSGNCIWYDNFRTVAVEQSGGKGGSSQVVGYNYYVSIAFGLCLKPSNGSVSLLELWKGKEKISLEDWIASDQIRFYDGTQTDPDSHIATFTTRDPVYKNLAYVVFPNLALGSSPYLPQFSYEVSTSTVNEADVFVDQVDGSGTVISGYLGESDGEMGKRMAVNPTTGLIVCLNMWWVDNPDHWQSAVVSRYSDDYGVTWSTPSVLILDDIGEYFPCDLQFDGGYFWAAVANEYYEWLRIYKSSDGDTWSLHKEIDVSALLAASHWGAYGWGIDELSYAVAGDYHMITGTECPVTIWYSSDGGVNFSYTDLGAAYPGYPSYYSYATIKCKSDGTGILLCYYNPTSGAGDANYIIERSSNGGATWVIVKNFSHYYTSNYFDEVFHIGNYGDVWAISGKWLTTFHADPGSSTTQLVDGDYFAMLVSNDNGVTWAAIDVPPRYEYKPYPGAYYTGYNTPGIAVADDGSIIFTMKWAVYNTLTGSTIKSCVAIWQYKGGRWIKIYKKTSKWVYFLATCGTIRAYIDANDRLRVILHDSKIHNDTNADEILSTIAIIYEPDVLPTKVTKDALTSDLYGLGLEESVFDSTAETATDTYCNDNDIKVSMSFDSQRSILDVMQYVLSHHDGFMTYADGIISHKQLKAEASIKSLTSQNFQRVAEEFPINISKKGDRDFFNTVNVEWTKRGQEYVIGTAKADDPVDRGEFGLKDRTISLDGLCEFTRASKMAYRYLKKSIYNPDLLAGRLGPENSDLRPGDVVDITDTETELSGTLFRILTMKEKKGVIDTTFSEESPGLYDFVSSGDDTEEDLGNTPGPSDGPGRVVYPLVVEVAPLYSQISVLLIDYNPTGFVGFAGASLYRSYDAGISYAKVKEIRTDGVTGKQYVNGPNYIDVVLYNYETTFSSADSYSSLIRDPYLNLFVIKKSGQKDLYCKFQTAEYVGTATANIWRLSDLIIDLTGTPYSGGTVPPEYTVEYTANMVFYEAVPYYYVCTADDLRKTLYFKLATLTSLGTEQDLSECYNFTEYVDGLTNTPVPPTGFMVNGIGCRRYNYYGNYWDWRAIIKANIDVVISWQSQNRFADGRSDMTRSDAIVEDEDFDHFEIEVYSAFSHWDGQGTLERTETTTSQTFTYDTTMQTADGTTSGELVFKISKISTAGYESTAIKVTVPRV